MELRHLRYFVVLAETLHFAQAAAQLDISPPALTKQIQELERLLGVRLLNRTKRSVALSTAGEVFLQEARQTLLQASRAADAARRAGRGEIGRMAIGYVASAAYTGLLQDEVARFRHTHPQVALTLAEGVMEQLPLQVSNGSIDLAFIRAPVTCPDNVVLRTMLHDEFILALPADSPLCAPRHDATGDQQDIAATALADCQFILPEQPAGTMEVGRRGRFTPRVHASPGGLVAVITLVSLGQGVAVVPASVMEKIDMPGVRYRRLAGKPIPSTIALASRRHEKSPVVNAFLAQLRRR